MNQVNVSKVKVHEIALDERHAVLLTFPPATSWKLASQTIRKLKELLEGWRTSNDPFLVIGLLDGLELRFVKKEPNGVENRSVV